MRYDDEAVQHAERHGGHGEEIAGGENLAMIVQEGQPLLTGIAAAHDTPQIAATVRSAMMKPSFGSSA